MVKNNVSQVGWPKLERLLSIPTAPGGNYTYGVKPHAVIEPGANGYEWEIGVGNLGPNLFLLTFCATLRP